MILMFARFNEFPVGNDVDFMHLAGAASCSVCSGVWGQVVLALLTHCSDRLFPCAGMRLVAPAPLRRQVQIGRGLLIMAKATCKGCTLRGTRRARTRTSGFRTRRRTYGGRRVLSDRRKKGRATLCPAHAYKKTGDQGRDIKSIMPKQMKPPPEVLKAMQDAADQEN